ncbi:substrate-binding domain-containing protein [Halegenticoccus soli]|uniref:substrate-binding domain-containing protein n=1 Tax=Halegenticoccus soli TaxID=1985678 RepID=UPI000C6D41E9|nr:substrate-binding domain-containing protein [Halegenticoccus soli]
MLATASRRRFLRRSAIVGTGVLAGCLTEGENSAKYSTAVSIPSVEYQFFVRLQDRYEQLQKERDISGTFYDAQNSVSQQVSDVETAVTNDVDFIAISPITEQGVTPAVKNANEADVPVINIDRTIKGAEVATHIASDNVQMGVDATNKCLEFMRGIADKSSYNLLELRGTPGTSVANDRNEGLKRALKENDSLSLLGSQNAEFSTSEAVSVMEDFVTSHGDKIDGVYAHNDLMALGAHRVIQDSNLSDIPIVGIDGTDTWVQTFSDNQYYATVAQLPEKMMSTAVDVGIEVVEGKEVKEFYQTEAPIITQENAQQYLDEYF